MKLKPIPPQNRLTTTLTPRTNTARYHAQESPVQRAQATTKLNTPKPTDAMAAVPQTMYEADPNKPVKSNPKYNRPKPLKAFNPANTTIPNGTFEDFFFFAKFHYQRRNIFSWCGRGLQCLLQGAGGVCIFSPFPSLCRRTSE